MILTDELLESALAELAREELEKLPSNEELKSFYQIPKQFDRKMLRLIRDWNRTPRMRLLVRYAKRAAVYFLALLIVAGTTIMTVSAAREWFIRVISQVFSTHTQLDYAPENSTQQGLDFVAYAPSLLPDGYILEKSQINERVRIVQLRYQNASGGGIVFFQTFKGAMHIDTEDAETDTVEVNGRDALYVRKENRQTLSWSDNNAYFLLQVDDPSVGEEELIAMGKSIAPLEET